MANYDQFHDKLTSHGYIFVSLSDSNDPLEAVYESRTNPHRIVNVPCNSNEPIPDSVVHALMKTANIPYTEYSDIVNSVPPADGPVFRIR